MSARNGPTVLVTGGAGRLGRLVVAASRELGIRTLALSRRPGGDTEDDLVADLADTEAVMTALRGRPIDTIIHLAAAVHREDAVELNARIDATLEAIVHAAAPGAVIFTSTAAVYGDSTPHALTESSPTLGESPYALSKLASENLLRALAATRPTLAVTVLRVFNIAGPDFPGSLVQRLLTADPAHPARLTSPDSFVRDYIHQSDIVRVILASAARTAPGFHLFNVGAGVPITTRSLLGSLGVGDDAWVEVEGNESVSWCDNSAVVHALGVIPSTPPTPAWQRPTVG